MEMVTEILPYSTNISMPQPASTSADFSTRCPLLRINTKSTWKALAVSCTGLPSQNNRCSAGSTRNLPNSYVQRSRSTVLVTYIVDTRQALTRDGAPHDSRVGSTIDIDCNLVNRVVTATNLDSSRAPGCVGNGW